MQWYRVDLHLHTPSSADYMAKDASYLDILRRAEQRGVDIIAFTDHNTVNGYAAMVEDVERLMFLEQLGRAQPDEMRTLAEYRRLLEKILVLPGFEFTATFGFHILGIFSPDTPLREIEYILMRLNVPREAIEAGTSQVGASADVLTAYQAINNAGGICIAAHANTTHGVAMRGMDFGGQTRIAYTQDRNLHALEVTDLSKRGRRTTQSFFDGTKSEYPRRMRCIQGSDAHHLDTVRDRGRIATLGVGERVTEMLLRERSFDALLELFQSTDFSRSRPYNPDRQPEDYVQSARNEGPSVVQAFHEKMTKQGGRLYSIIADVCAFANTNGGTIYVGVSADKNAKPVGITDPRGKIEFLSKEIETMIDPTLNVELDTLETQGKTVIRIQVPFGEERPYAIDNTKIYVRDEADTTIAIRDEIVTLVQQGVAFSENAGQRNVQAPVSAPPPAVPPQLSAESTDTNGKVTPPRSGVEIVGSEQRGDTRYYIMRDLRNGNIVKNVTRASARRLWHYAIKQEESKPAQGEKIQWRGDIGLVRHYKKGGAVRYDLVQRDNGNLRTYYGATEDGMPGAWQQFVVEDDSDN